MGEFLSVEFADMPQEAHDISISEVGIKIRAGSGRGAKLALQTLRQIGMQSGGRGFRFAEISDAPDLEVRGFMLDISRCKVPKLGELSRLVDMLALFKYNRLELYMEHTFAFEGHEIVWAGASPLSPAAVRKLGEICAVAGVELVPNMNGLGHMERWLRYPEYRYLAESEAPFVDPLGTVRKYPTTLYPDGRALDFMDSLYAQLLPNFEGENFNIGGDEPWELGMGRSRARCEAEGGKYGVYIAHMLGLRERAAKYGKQVCFWADVLMQSPEYSELLPCDMTPILWGYYLDHPYEEQCSYMKGLGRDFLVAPGTSTWNSFGSRWDCAFKNIQTACGCAKKHGARGMILTQWGDGGNHQPWCAMYPAIAAAAACAWGTAPAEERVCDALDRFVFIDASGEFSRALCALGRADPVQKLFCFYHKMFFAPPADAEKLAAERGETFYRFLAERQRAVMEEESRFLREELGVKAILTNLNNNASPSLQPFRDTLPLLDAHIYHDHPSFPMNNWKPPVAYSQTSDIANYAAAMRGSMPVRIPGKPLIVTEINYCYPNRFRSEMGAVAGAYSALQDWDGLYRFCYEFRRENIFSPKAPGSFSTLREPISLLTERIIWFLFVRGDVAPAPNVPLAYIWKSERYGQGFPPEFSRLGLIGRIGSVAADSQSDRVRKVDTSREDWIAKLPPEFRDAAERFRKKASVTSLTGEIELDPAKVSLRVVTPKSEVLTFRDGEARGRFLRVKNANDFVTVSVHSLDGKPLAESRDLLLFHLTDALASEANFQTPTRNLMFKDGKSPILVARGRADVMLAVTPDGKWSVEALAADGSVIAPVKCESGTDGIRFPVETHRPEGTTMIYHLTRQ